jgi:hypothetical protein
LPELRTVGIDDNNGKGRFALSDQEKERRLRETRAKLETAHPMGVGRRRKTRAGLRLLIALFVVLWLILLGFLT